MKTGIGGEDDVELGRAVALTVELVPVEGVGDEAEDLLLEVREEWFVARRASEAAVFDELKDGDVDGLGDASGKFLQL